VNGRSALLPPLGHIIIIVLIIIIIKAVTTAPRTSQTTPPILIKEGTVAFTFNKTKIEP